jgi:hypothetical protein
MYCTLNFDEGHIVSVVLRWHDSSPGSQDQPPTEPEGAPHQPGDFVLSSSLQSEYESSLMPGE